MSGNDSSRIKELIPDIFVELGFEIPARFSVMSPHKGYAESATLSFDQFFSRSTTRPTLVLGAAGAGKSTVLAKLAAADLNEEHYEIGVAFVECAGAKDVEYLRDRIHRSVSEASKTETARIKLYVDGVNEITSGELDLVFRELAEISAAEEDVTVIASCRGSDIPPWIHNSFDVLLLKPIERQQVDHYLERSIQEGVLTPQVFRDWKDILGNVRFYDLLKLPLLLAIFRTVCSRLDITKPNDFSGAKAILYDAFYKWLLQREKQKESEAAQVKRMLLDGERHKLVHGIAWAMEDQSQVRISMLDLEEYCNDVLGKYSSLSTVKSRALDAAAIAKELVRSPPFVVRQDLLGGAEVGFVHQSIGEFLAARSILYGDHGQSTTELLAELLTKERKRRHWDVIRFASQQNSISEQVVGSIFKIARETGQQSLMALAAACVSEQILIDGWTLADLQIRVLDAFKNWGFPFDYELIRSLNALPNDSDSHPCKRLNADVEYFTEKYGKYDFSMLHDVDNKTLVELVLRNDTAQPVKFDAIATLVLNCAESKNLDQALGKQLMERFEEMTERVQEQIVETLKVAEAQYATEWLESLVVDESRGDRLQAFALNALGVVGGVNSANLIINYMKEPSNPYRDSASWSLQTIARRIEQADPEQFKAIINLYLELITNEPVTDDNDKMFGNVIYSLAKLSAIQEHEEAFFDWATKLTNGYVLEDAIQAFTICRTELMEEFIFGSLSSEDPVVRLKTLEYLTENEGWWNSNPDRPRSLMTYLAHDDKARVVSEASKELLTKLKS